MREIKFRAWDIYKKKFIPSDVFAICSNPEGREQATMIQDWEEYRIGEYFYPEYQVITQYTGLKDKNGKEIYEGDIVKIFDWGIKTKNNVLSISEVYWSCKEHGWDLHPNPIDGDRYDFFRDNWEIIGNIYENPELIKVKEE